MTKTPHTAITFTEQGKQTLISWHMLFETAEQFQQVIKIGEADEVLAQNIEKLYRYLQDTKLT